MSERICLSSTVPMKDQFIKSKDIFIDHRWFVVCLNETFMLLFFYLYSIFWPAWSIIDATIARLPSILLLLWSVWYSWLQLLLNCVVGGVWNNVRGQADIIGCYWTTIACNDDAGFASRRHLDRWNMALTSKPIGYTSATWKTHPICLARYEAQTINAAGLWFRNLDNCQLRPWKAVLKKYFYS